MLKPTILEGFNHVSEEVKSASSYALGNISLGNLKEYLPFVLKEIETQPKRQYLLLHSLKEVRATITCSKMDSFVDVYFCLQIISAQSLNADSVLVLGPYIPAIWDQLFKHCECEEEGEMRVQSFVRKTILHFSKEPVTLWPSVLESCA